MFNSVSQTFIRLIIFYIFKNLVYNILGDYMYKIVSNNVNLKIALISDIHYSYKINRKVFNKILKKFNNIKPDYICIPGDIIDESTDYDSNVYDFFEKLSKISKVIISLGNHDLSSFDKSKMTYNDSKWYESLKKIKNLYVLNNEQVTFNNITFTGYTASFSEDNTFIDNPNNTLKDLKKLKFSVNEYNILLCHSPQSILGSDALYNNTFIKNQNLILCGHMHNGMVPPIIDKIFKSNTGIIAPSKKFFPKYSRGLIKFNNTTLIICKGITKLAKHSSFLRPLKYLYPIEIEQILINKKNDL